MKGAAAGSTRPTGEAVFAIIIGTKGAFVVLINIIADEADVIA